MLIPFAHPLASEEEKREIQLTISKKIQEKSLISGIKACQKKILEGKKGLLVLTGDTTPMDLISHLPGLCESKEVEYRFLESKKEIPNEYTCVFLED